MKPGPLTWSAQVAAHVAFVEAHHIDLAPPVRNVTPTHRSTAAERNRAALLHALGDGKPHHFADLVAALPKLSRQGVYYLCDQLKAEKRIEWTLANRSTRIYRLT